MSRLRFHHIGVACLSIDDALAWFRLLGYRPESGAFIDPGQGVRGVFLAGPGTRVELLEQLAGSTVLTPWLTSNVRLYHQAFESDRLDQDVADLRRAGAVVVSWPSPAVAFGGRRIAFLMLPGMLLVELVDADARS